MYGLPLPLLDLSLKMKRRNTRSSIKQLTVCAMLTALGVILMGIGTLVEVLDISTAVIASCCVVIALIEYGKGTPWMVYAAISVLSFLLLPNKFPAMIFTLFVGFYPILKEKLDKKHKVIRWVLKELIFNVCLAIIILLYMLLFFESATLAIPLPLIIVVAVILCEVVFVMYDIALDKMIDFYVIKLRHRLKLK